MLGIIFVNYRSSLDLNSCLESIKNNELNYKDYEYIVVDNNSGDIGLKGIEERYSFLKIIYAPENNGFAYGNNIGIRNSRGDCIMLLNPDTVVEDDSLGKMYRRLTGDDAIDFIGPKLLFPDGSNQSYYEPKSHLTLWRLFCDKFYLHRVFPRSSLLNSYYRTWMDYDRETFVEAVAGSAFMFKRRVIEKLGFLDENYFMYFEESDYCLRAVRNGYRLLYYPESNVVHRGGLISETNWERSTRDYTRSFKYYFRKNFSWVTYRLAIPIFIAGSLLRALILRIRKDARYRYYLYFAKHALSSG
jgi:GT2 family glycosyltransferase